MADGRVATHGGPPKLGAAGPLVENPRENPECTPGDPGAVDRDQNEADHRQELHGLRLPGPPRAGAGGRKGSPTVSAPISCRSPPTSSRTCRCQARAPFRPGRRTPREQPAVEVIVTKTLWIAAPLLSRVMRGLEGTVVTAMFNRPLDSREVPRAGGGGRRHGRRRRRRRGRLAPMLARGVLHAQLHRAATTEDHSLRAIAGLLVLADDAPESLEPRLTLNGRPLDVTWGQPSPRTTGRWPERPARARPGSWPAASTRRGGGALGAAPGDGGAPGLARRRVRPPGAKAQRGWPWC